MTENNTQSEQFTGLILVTGVDARGIASSLFECLSPFAVHVIDIEQIVINDRLILTVLIGANPAHQSAIEADLEECALNLGVDIATLFGKSQLPALASNLVEVNIAASKLHPRSVSQLARAITDSGANIQRFVRTSENPVAICLSISGLTREEIEATLASISFEDAASITVNIS
jgi:phosphoserine phosphatase